MSWIVNEPNDKDNEHYLDLTEAFVLVTNTGDVALIFRRGERERYIHGADLHHFGLTAEYVLESVEAPDKKTEGLYDIPPSLLQPLISHSKQISGLFKQEAAHD